MTSYLRLRRGDGTVSTYPASAYQYLYHNSRGHVYIAVDSHSWSIAECCSDAEACVLEALLLHQIETARFILDVQAVADRLLQVMREADDEDEAREMSTLDAILEARERDRETHYDGVRPDHTDLECRGGDA